MTQKRWRVAVVGLGKIAHDQHLPVIAGDAAFELVGVVSRRGVSADGVPTFATTAELYDAIPDVDAVSLCTPPTAHFAAAREAMLAGKHVMLEKPPTASIAEMAELERVARETGKVLFTTWHSQYNRGVAELKNLLRVRAPASIRITWKEDVRRWHPGQAWIWEPGGYGVLDPGINAMSILTEIAPVPVYVESTDLNIPANCQTPIAASIRFAAPGSSIEVSAELDWLQTGPQTWDFDIETVDGQIIKLADGGARLLIDGEEMVGEDETEYAQIYRRFDDLLTRGESLIDVAPMHLISDALLLGRRHTVDPFHDDAAG